MRLPPATRLPGCPVQTFGEQVPGVLDRYQRRTTRLAGQAGEAVRRLAGRAGAGLLMALGVPLSRQTALRMLLRLALPEVAVPRVLGVDLRAATRPGLRDHPDRRRDRAAGRRPGQPES